MLDHLINKLKEDRPDISDAAIIKAMVFVYKNIIALNSEYVSSVEKSYAKSMLENHPTRETSVRFKPSVMISLMGASELEGLSVAQYISEAAKRVSSLLLDEKEKNEFKAIVQAELLEYALIAA